MIAPSMARVGALVGVLSVVVTFIGSGVHGGLPNAATESDVRGYIASANSV
jgi:hypothetical protein